MPSRSMNILRLGVFTLFIATVNGLTKQGIIQTFTPTANWAFITRFCFLSLQGRLEFEFIYPKDYDEYIDGRFHPQNIILYFDDQWPNIYPGDPSMNCYDKLSTVVPENNQIINLTTRYFWSGCSVQQLDLDGLTQDYYVCKGGRTFSSRRERWWYIVVANCGTTKGLYLRYNINMTNAEPGNPFKQHFSADEFYIFEESIVAAITYLSMIVLTIGVAVSLNSRQLYHTTYKIFMSSVILTFSSIVCMIVYYSDYSLTGIPLNRWKDAAQFLDLMQHGIYIILLILMGKGYTITRSRIRPIGVVKTIIFVILYILLCIAMFIYEERSFDEGLVLYFHQSLPGYILLGFKLFAWIWCLYGIIFTIKNYPEKRRFYITFMITLSLWFWAGPITILLANLTFPAWIREKVVTGILLSFTFIGHLIFLILTWPTRANENFPYHIKTTQIGAMIEEPPSGRNGQANGLGGGGAYAPNNSEITSDTDVPLGERNFIDMFSAQNPPATDSQDSPTVNPDQFPHQTHSAL